MTISNIQKKNLRTKENVKAKSNLTISCKHNKTKQCTSDEHVSDENNTDFIQLEIAFHHTIDMAVKHCDKSMYYTVL